MNLRSIALNAAGFLLLASCSLAQNYTITLYSQPNGTGNVVMTYSGPMLSPTETGTVIHGFVTNPPAMPWNTPPIAIDGQAGSLNPCSVFLGNGGPNGEASITCESAAPGTSNGVPLFSFCFQGVQWPMPAGTYNVDGAHFSSCGNYFVAYPQISGYGFAYAQLNSGSIVVALAQGGTWSTRAPMPTARWSTGIGVVNGIIYVMGGTASATSSGSDFAALEAYDPTSDTWSIKAPMPTPRHSFGVSVVNGILYTVGGFAFNCLCSVPTVEAYDPRSDTWVTKAPMPTARNGLATGVVNGIIYAAGGNSPSSLYLATVEAYDPVSDTWSTRASMPTARYEPAAGVVDEMLYVVGGSNHGNLSTLEAYEATTDTWSTKSALPTPRYYLGSGVLNELLFAVGGYNDSVALSSVEAYDPTIQSWTAVTPMPTARVPSVAVVDGVLYAVGGYDYLHGLPLSTVEAFTPTTPGAAELNGGNTLTGNQTVNGTVSATGFVGNGAGLTNVNASSLGGLSASNYARLDIGNSFVGDQIVNGSVHATSFAGDGSALTGVTAQTASTANAAGTANFALSAGDSMTLGGNLPSAFATASTLASYVSKSGDIMSGILNLPANGLVAGTNQFVLSGGNVGIGTASPGAGLLWSQMGYPTRLHLQNAGFNMSAVQATSTGSSAILYAEGRTNGCAECGSGGGLLGLADTAAPPNNRILDIISWGGKMQFRRVSDDYGQQLAVPLTIDYTSNANGNVGIGTHSPTAMLEVNGTAKFDNTVTFAAGQTFPGTGNGTITGVTAGSGLSGGGSNGNVTLSVDSTVARTSASNTFTAPQSVSGALTATSFSGSGAGLTALNPANLSAGTAAINISGNAATAGLAANSTALGGVAAGNYARLDTGNNFSGTQSVSGDVSATGTVSATNATFAGPLVAGLQGGVSTAGMLINRKGGATNTQGFSSYPLALWASSFSSSTAGPWNQIFQLVAEPTGNNTSNPSATMSLQFISTNFPPTPNGYTFQETGFSVGANGQTTTGALTIGTGGTPIVEYVSTTYSATLPALTSGSCTTFTTTALTAFAPGNSDTIALGLPKSLVSSLGSNIFLIYQAWETANTTSPTITIQVCNPTGSRYAGGAAGTIRIDVFKH